MKKKPMTATVIQSEKDLPPGYVRASTYYQGLSRAESTRIAARITHMVAKKKIQGFKLLPQPGQAFTPPETWPLFVHPSDVAAGIRAAELARQRREGVEAEEPAVVSIDRPSTAVAEAFASLAGELTLLRQEMQAMRQALVAVESALMGPNLRPVEECHA